MRLPDLIADAFPPRPMGLHKYTSGTVTVVGGSHRFVHAPILSGLGARVAGAGLIHLVVPDASRIVAAVLVPEATFLKQTATCVPPKADVTVAGMGLGVSSASEMLVSRLLSGSAGRFVLDADALSILANWYARAGEPPARVPGQTLVLTPHAGEAARLLNCRPEEIAADRPGALRRIIDRYHAITVLKGAHTLVGMPQSADVFECTAGNPFMALGGMGDLLSGMIAARWAYLTHNAAPNTPVEKLAFQAAASAVFLHATASDNLVNKDIPEDPSVAATAHQAAVLRVMLERTSQKD